MHILSYQGSLNLAIPIPKRSQSERIGPCFTLSGSQQFAKCTHRIVDMATKKHGNETMLRPPFIHLSHNKNVFRSLVKKGIRTRKLIVLDNMRSTVIKYGSISILDTPHLSHGPVSGYNPHFSGGWYQTSVIPVILAPRLNRLSKILRLECNTSGNIKRTIVWTITAPSI